MNLDPAVYFDKREKKISDIIIKRKQMHLQIFLAFIKLKIEFKVSKKQINAFSVFCTLTLALTSVIVPLDFLCELSKPKYNISDT